MVLVGFHATAGRVNNEHSWPGGALFQNLIHDRHHFFLASHGIETMVSIPHVAHDDGRLLGLPKNFLVLDFKGAFFGGNA